MTTEKNAGTPDGLEKNPDAFVNAMISIEEGDYEEAIKQFEAAVLESAGHREKLARIYYFKGTCHLMLKAPEEAMKCFAEAVENNPEYEEALLKGADLYVHFERYEEASNNYDMYLRLEKNNAAALSNKGYCLNRLGRFEAAVEYLDRAISLDANCFLAWYNKAESLQALNMNEKAAEAYAKASELKPDDECVHYDMGTILMRLGRYAEAVSCFERAARIEPRYIKAWYNMSLAAEQAGRMEDAVAGRKRFVELAEAENAYPDKVKQSKEWITKAESTRQSRK